jgi:plastocyanin
MGSRVAGLLIVTAIALAAVGGAAAHPRSAKTTTVRVAMKDFSFVLSTKTVKHGKVTFAIRNTGQTSHDFSIAGHTSKVIGPGKRTTLTVTLKRGSDPYKCTIDAHASLGMKGVLHVT